MSASVSRHIWKHTVEKSLTNATCVVFIRESTHRGKFSPLLIQVSHPFMILAGPNRIGTTPFSLRRLPSEWVEWMWGAQGRERLLACSQWRSRHKRNKAERRNNWLLVYNNFCTNISFQRIVQQCVQWNLGWFLNKSNFFLESALDFRSCSLLEVPLRSLPWCWEWMNIALERQASKSTVEYFEWKDLH